ncbi:hypothetical protein [Streptomyces aureus]|uniref:CBS domain-containing protein n=1 Tax=Streptomyces aureus TaxID=193461 RepID=A0ABV4SUA6_9ACTN
MTGPGVGALPICGGDERLKGVLTDRDIVVRFWARGRTRCHRGGGAGAGRGRGPSAPMATPSSYCARCPPTRSASCPSSPGTS